MDTEQILQKLPESELTVMQTIWEMDRLGIEEIHAGAMMTHTPALARLKLTTVLTLTSRLIAKKFVEGRKIGRRSCYTPLVTEEDYTAFATRNFIDTVCRSSTAGLISALLGSDSLSESDIAALRRLVDSAEKEPK